MALYHSQMQLHVIKIATLCNPCADPGLFARGRGVQTQLSENNSDVFFSPQLILSGRPMVLSKKTIIFPRFQRGSNFFQGGGGGGSNFFRGGGGGGGGGANDNFYRNSYYNL